MSDDIESYVSPICLPWNSNDPGYSTTAGQVLTSTGWGTTTNDRAIVNKVLWFQSKLILVAFNDIMYLQTILSFSELWWV